MQRVLSRQLRSVADRRATSNGARNAVSIESETIEAKDIGGAFVPAKSKEAARVQGAEMRFHSFVNLFSFSSVVFFIVAVGIVAAPQARKMYQDYRDPYAVSDAELVNLRRADREKVLQRRRAKAEEEKQAFIKEHGEEAWLRKQRDAAAAAETEERERLEASGGRKSMMLPGNFESKGVERQRQMVAAWAKSRAAVPGEKEW